MRECLFISSLLTINVLVSGQANFVKSVVINNNGDSIYGNIDYRNWKNNPNTINFMNAANQKQTFDASSIRGFYIPTTHETYKSFTVELDLLPDDQDKALNKTFIDSPSDKKRVFLLQLVKHPAVSLYLFATQGKDHFYYMKGNEEPVELIHYYVYDESSRQIREDAKYKEQLSSLVASCPSLVAKARTIRFRKNEIQDIVLKCVQCIAPGSVAEIKKNDPVSFEFGIIAGVMLNQFDFTGTDPFLVDENYSSTLSPILGFLSNGSLRPNINFGIANGLMIAENKNNSHRSYSFGVQEEVKAIDGPRKYEFSILAGLGLAIRNSVQLELRYAASSKSFSPYHTLDVNTMSFQFIFTCHF